jgi:hypothetical protein
MKIVKEIKNKPTTSQILIIVKWKFFLCFCGYVFK